MILKNHLIEVFKKASSENNILLKENIVLKWVHRFGIDSLNDLLIHTPAIKEYQLEEENQDQTTLMDELYNQLKLFVLDFLLHDFHQLKLFLLDFLLHDEIPLVLSYGLINHLKNQYRICAPT